MDDDAKPYLLSEASRLTGLSVDAIRKRIERRTWRGSRSNEDGQWRVWLTSKDVRPDETGQLPDMSRQSLDAQLDESRTIKALESELATVREALTREKERADRAAGDAAIQQTRAEVAEREREAARVAAAMAEGELKGGKEALAIAREALAEARRPFWRRWIGP
jgi:hypothetical protein